MLCNAFWKGPDKNRIYTHKHNKNDYVISIGRKQNFANFKLLIIQLKNVSRRDNADTVCDNCNIPGDKISRCYNSL